MRKDIHLLLGLLCIVLIFISAPQASAHHQQMVLGASTPSNNSSISIPPTVEGPGLILPDSPLYVLDNLKQATRLFLAFTPEAKAKVYANIAGERMAELRVMIARDTIKGVETALEGVTQNYQKAADELKIAHLAGRDISKLAKELNDDIKLKQQTFDFLEEQASGQLRARVKAQQESLLVAKVHVEDFLSADDLENEIADNLQRQITRGLNSTTEAVLELEHDINALVEQASEAAEQSLTRREQALRKAIEEKNEQLRREQERLLLAERKKQLDIKALHEKTVAQTKETVRSAQQAAQTVESTTKTIGKLQNEPTDEEVAGISSSSASASTFGSSANQ